jgi:hypothetical protein
MKDFIPDILGALIVFAVLVSFIGVGRAVAVAILAVPFARAWLFVGLHWLADTHAKEERLPQTLVGLLCGIFIFCLIML